MKQANAKKRLSEKSVKIIFLITVFVVITSIISVTFAWYVDRKTDIGIIQFGAIEIDRTGSFFQTAAITNLIPGESFLSKIFCVVFIKRGVIAHPSLTPHSHPPTPSRGLN